MRQVWTYLIAMGVLALAGNAAHACSVMEQTKTGVEQGEQCAVSYLDPKGDVFSSPARKLGPNTVAQMINTGNGCTGEQIVVYYDCATKQAVWMGGGYDMMAVFTPMPAQPSANGEFVPPEMVPGPAAYFDSKEIQSFAPAYSIDAIWASAEELDWMPQRGRVNTSTITVDGKRFNLACGCDLPQTGGN